MNDKPKRAPRFPPAYAVVNERGYLVATGAAVPIYWLKYIATEAAKLYGGRVVKVRIEESR